VLCWCVVLIRYVKSKIWIHKWIVVIVRPLLWGVFLSNRVGKPEPKILKSGRLRTRWKDFWRVFARWPKTPKILREWNRWKWGVYAEFSEWHFRKIEGFWDDRNSPQNRSYYYYLITSPIYIQANSHKFYKYI